MSFYLLLKMQENLYYISVVAELANIFYYLSVLLGFDLPYGYAYGVSLFNAIYACYIFFIIILTQGKFKICAYIILTLSILKSYLWGDIPIISIVDSVVCIGILIYYHQFIYVIIKEIEEAKKRR